MKLKSILLTTVAFVGFSTVGLGSVDAATPIVSH